MKKGSEDIRSLAVRNVLAGKHSVAQVAEMTGYCIATIYNWIRGCLHKCNILITFKKSSRLPRRQEAFRVPERVTLLGAIRIDI